MEGVFFILEGCCHYPNSPEVPKNLVFFEYLKNFLLPGLCHTGLNAYSV
jgi:hypothetical protein